MVNKWERENAAAIAILHTKFMHLRFSVMRIPILVMWCEEFYLIYQLIKKGVELKFKKKNQKLRYDHDLYMLGGFVVCKYRKVKAAEIWEF